MARAPRASRQPLHDQDELTVKEIAGLQAVDAEPVEGANGERGAGAADGDAPKEFTRGMADDSKFIPGFYPMIRAAIDDHGFLGGIHVCNLAEGVGGGVGNGVG